LNLLALSFQPLHKLRTYFTEASYLYDSFSIYHQSVNQSLNQYKTQQIQDYLVNHNIDDFLNVNNITFDKYFDGNHGNRTTLGGWKYPDSWVSVNKTIQMTATYNRTRMDGPMWYHYTDSLPPVNDFKTFLNSIDYGEILRNHTYILQRIKRGNFTGKQ